MKPILCAKEYHPCDKVAIYYFSYEAIDINEQKLTITKYYCQYHADLCRRINLGIELKMLNPKLESML